MPDIVNGPVRVDIRSFGVRTPPCTRDNPTYGIIGLFHLLPPAGVAVAAGGARPRKSSITDSAGMSSEASARTGVRHGPQSGSGQPRWAVRDNTRTRYIRVPADIGAWRVGF